MCLTELRVSGLGGKIGRNYTSQTYRRITLTLKSFQKHPPPIERRPSSVTSEEYVCDDDPMKSPSISVYDGFDESAAHVNSLPLISRQQRRPSEDSLKGFGDEPFNGVQKHPPISPKRRSLSEDSLPGFSENTESTDHVNSLPSISPKARRISMGSVTSADSVFEPDEPQRNSIKSPSISSVYDGFDPVDLNNELYKILKNKTSFTPKECTRINDLLDEIRGWVEGYELSSRQVTTVLGNWFSHILRKRNVADSFSITDIVSLYSDINHHLSVLRTEPSPITQSLFKREQSYSLQQSEVECSPFDIRPFDRVVFQIAEDSEGVRQAIYKHLKRKKDPYSDHLCETICDGACAQQEAYQFWLDELKSDLATLYQASNLVSSGKIDLKKIPIGLAANAIGSCCEEVPILKTAVKISGSVVEELVQKARLKRYDNIKRLIKGRQPWTCAEIITADVDTVLKQLSCQRDKGIKSKVFKWISDYMKHSYLTDFDQARTDITQMLKSNCLQYKTEQISKI